MKIEILKNRLLKDKEIKKAYDKLRPQYAIAEMIIKKRLKMGLTQKTLAEKIGTKQSAIARLESGKINPTLSFLINVAEALNGKLDVALK